MRGLRIGMAAAYLLALGTAAPGQAEELGDADALVKRVEEIFRGDTAQIKASMTIERPRWTRSIKYRSWDDRVNDRSLVRILEPSKDRGTGFLRESRTLWTYLPRVERTTRIPPSMMLQPWMGSDFTNDDLVRESSLVDDYDPADLGTRDLEGRKLRGVALTPHPDAPVVWARMEIWVDPESLAPVRQIFYDEPEPGKLEPVREMRFEDVRDVQGRPLPHRWEMRPLQKPDHATRVEIEEITYDEPLSDELFTQSNLRRSEAAR